MTRTFFTLLAATALLAPAAFAAPETYKLDANHTNIVWYANHFGFSNPSGRFGIKDGTLTLDEAAPASSKIDVTIDVAGLQTGIPLFNEHLAADKFLNSGKFPTAKFTSTKVDVTGKDTAKVTGNFTLRGVTKPVTLDMKLNKLAPNPMSNIKTAGFSGTITLKRSEFGIDTYVPNVSDEVAIRIESEANLITATTPAAPAKK